MSARLRNAETITDPDARAAPVAPAEPESYRVLDEIGRGGMGRVVRAEDVELGRLVAIKQLAAEGDVARMRFEREARITARLQHPAIVPVYEVGEDAEGRPFYAMKLVSGRTLSQAIAGALYLPARLALVRNVVVVAEAVAYAHSQGVIHRDLKASNVVLGEFGETIVIDWGLAKDLTIDDDVPAGISHLFARELTCDGDVIGTPAYMPPEQAAGDAVDERADVYAIGAMLYHVLGGALPYRGERSRDVVAAVLAGPPPPIVSRVPEVPRDLAAIVDKAMARDRRDRYPSARELAIELERYLDGKLVGARRYGPGERLARWARRRRPGARLIALVAIALAAAGGAAIARLADERDAALRRADELEQQLQDLRSERGMHPALPLGQEKGKHHERTRSPEGTAR